MTRLLLSPTIALLMGFSLLGCGSRETPPHQPDAGSQRTLTGGDVVGYRAANGALAWLGIPYAAPPVGPLRWRAPRPSPAWPGLLEATRFGSACPQRGSWLGGAPPEAVGELFGSEDCLFVNVWAPAEVPAEGLPVMLWIHGGGNVNGHGGFYDFSQMAERFDLVMLTFNYRLGGLGWFYHPALWSEDDDALDRSGNFGLLDQVALLRWVQENIGVFGGDPDRVTLFGESAGGQDTLALMVSPVSAGLFRGAIAQSGYTSSVTPAEASQPMDTMSPGKNGSSGEMLLHWLQ
nr:carboxylesterase family protein [Myxococcota bacterium]